MGKPIRVPIYFILFIGDSWDIQLNKAFKLVHIIYKFATEKRVAAIEINQGHKTMLGVNLYFNPFHHFCTSSYMHLV